jgi:hypothetical protein
MKHGYEKHGMRRCSHQRPLAAVRPFARDRCPLSRLNSRAVVPIRSLVGRRRKERRCKEGRCGEEPLQRRLECPALLRARTGPATPSSSTEIFLLNTPIRGVQLAACEVKSHGVWVLFRPRLLPAQACPDAGRRRDILRAAGLLVMESECCGGRYPPLRGEGKRRRGTPRSDGSSARAPGEQFMRHPTRWAFAAFAPVSGLPRRSAAAGCGKNRGSRKFVAHRTSHRRTPCREAL